MSGDFRIDLHVHSRYSLDSSAELEAIVSAVMEGGLRGFALTDHNTTRGHAALRELSASSPGYLFIPGVEISTREGHLLAYGIHEAPRPGLPLAEAIEWVHARAGAVVLPHPFRWSHGVGRSLARTAEVSAIEGRNGHNSEIANARAEFVAAQRRIGTTGGSDAHRPEEVGRCHTVLSESAESPEDVIDQIRRGRCHAEGRSLTPLGQLRLGVVTGLSRVRRGFRAI